MEYILHVYRLLDMHNCAEIWEVLWAQILSGLEYDCMTIFSATKHTFPLRLLCSFISGDLTSSESLARILSLIYKIVSNTDTKHM